MIGSKEYFSKIRISTDAPDDPRGSTTDKNDGKDVLNQSNSSFIHKFMQKLRALSQIFGSVLEIILGCWQIRPCSAENRTLSRLKRGEVTDLLNAQAFESGLM